MANYCNYFKKKSYKKTFCTFHLWNQWIFPWYLRTHKHFLVSNPSIPPQYHCSPLAREIHFLTFPLEQSSTTNPINIKNLPNPKVYRDSNILFWKTTHYQMIWWSQINLNGTHESIHSEECKIYNLFFSQKHHVKISFLLLEVISCNMC